MISLIVLYAQRAASEQGHEAEDLQLLEQQSEADRELAHAMQTGANNLAELFAASIAVPAVLAPAAGEGGVGFSVAADAGASDRVGGGFGPSAPAATIAPAPLASAASAAAAAPPLATTAAAAAAPATSSTWASPPTPSGLPFAGSYVASGVLSSYVSSRVLSVCVLSRVLSSPGQLTRKANPFPTRTHAHKLYLSLPHAPTDAFHPALFVLFFESLGGMLNAGLARALSHTHALTHRGTNASLPASPRGSRGAIAASGGRGARNGHVRRVRAEPYPRRSVEV